MQANYNLERYRQAQEQSYDIAKGELQQGQKRSHWMWYIFPQIQGLAHSARSQYYALSGLWEVQTYLAHPTLGARLRELTQILLKPQSSDAELIFGRVDALKLRSSMTLFDMVEPQAIFAELLEKYFSGQRDKQTQKLAETI